ncbi:MAG: DUF3598 domain-containing protein [Alphaproteobacteria bacterium]|nr:DUF3598 domain-containing protein [Alphaproteobacteria bacterium]
MGCIRDRMPIVADQAGVWDGEYIHLDAEGREIDRHASRLVCRLEDGPDGVARLSQSNIYTWADGTREVRYFDGIFRGDRVWISNDLIDGWTASLSLDPTERTIMVGWTRVSEPDFRYYEMITVAEDRRAKNRTWHWYRRGRLFQRTIINETKTADDWAAYDDPSLLVYRPRSPIA